MYKELTAERDGVMELVGRTADGLGRLVGQHLKLARLELAGHVAAMSRGVGLIAVLAGMMMVGYALAAAGLAVLIGGASAVGLPLLAMGLGHVAVCGGGLLLAIARLRSRIS